MCHPAVIIAASVMQAGAQYLGAEQQADAMYKYNMERQKLTIANAADAARHQWEGIAAKTQQTRARAQLDINNALRNYRKADAKGQVSASAGGVEGLSVNEQELDWAQRFSDSSTSIAMNLSNLEDQLLVDSYAVGEQLEARRQGSMFAPLMGGNPLQAVATIAQGVGQAWGADPSHEFWS